MASYRAVATIGFAIVLATTVGCASLGTASPLRSFETSVVFQPSKYPDGDWSPADLAFEDVWFKAGDGTDLHGWYVRHPNPRGVLMYCHGNGGNIAGLSDLIRILNRRFELSVLAFDYRGYGRSSGTPSEAGVLQDARAARAWLADRETVAERDVILMGQSLGGGVAVDLAGRDQARALILASTFTSLPDVGAKHMPWLLPQWNMTMRLESIKKIDHYTGPVLISHGDADEVIPFNHGERLYQAAAGMKQFFREPGGRHNSPFSEDYFLALEEFLMSLDQVAVGSRDATRL